MFFSTEKAYFKVLLAFKLVFTLFSTIKAANINTLVQLPLKAPQGSSNIHAILTDVYKSKQYSLQENISVSDGIIARGKIVISGEQDSYNIHYVTSYNGVDTKQRLVVHDTNCSLYTHKETWDQTLPGIGSSLLNSLLLMGPSFVYRLRHPSFAWKSVKEKNIRGVMMIGATVQINNLLEITCYYKNNFDDKSGIENPSRIEFFGYGLGKSSKNKENFVLDIYRKDEIDIDLLQNEVQPQPGVGCPNYLFERKTIPKLQPDYLHYIMYEYVQGSTNARTISEIYADQSFKTLRLKTNLLGVKSEVIHDYNLGVSFIIEQGGSCNILSIGLNAPGIDSYGTFTLKALFLIDINSKYVGKQYMEQRSGFPVDVWESVQYNFKINGKKVDKAVITQYFAESRESIISSGYTLVRTMITTYKLDSMKYNFMDRITRDYMNMEKVGTEAEFRDSFKLKGCKYLTGDKTVTLNFKLTCDGSASYACDILSENDVYTLKRAFVSLFLSSGVISPLRIDNVEYRVKGDKQLEMEVKFLDSPDLKYVFESKSMSVSPDTFKKIIKVKANSPYECLEKSATSPYQIEFVIYRPFDATCGYLRNSDDLKEDTKLGQSCTVFPTPFHNLQRLKKELSLDRIHDTYLKYIGRRVYLWDRGSSLIYKITDVIDKTQDESHDHGTFVTETGEKLKIDNQITVTVPDAKTYTDCRRVCKEQLSCNLFSFCKTDISTDCRVRSELAEYYYLNASQVEKDEKCTIYALNIIYDYAEVSHRKFKAQISPAIETSSSYCAELCKSSHECLSFQYCGGFCSFNGFYTDSATEYDEGCSVYFPKVSQKYQKTGNKIVSEVIHTEMNLNLEQCSSLCDGWSDGETGCKSFNYCPRSKTESSCSLTKFSVKSSDTKTIEEDDCSNYELKDESKGKKNKESSSTKGTSGSAAFGIILLFLFVGSLLGLVVPFAIAKVKQVLISSSTNESYSWTRQVNELREN